MSPEQLQVILAAHALCQRTRGADGSRANLTRADLACANLACANLTHANLACANLTHANLTGANLMDADLEGADLACANLTRANLVRANLVRANLVRAVLTRANLAGTVLDPALTTHATEEQLAALGLEIRDGYAYGHRTQQSQHCGHTVYTPGIYTAPVFSRCRWTACHPGIYLASLRWLESQYPGVAAVPCRARVVDCIVAGGKCRAREIEVLPC